MKNMENLSNISQLSNETCCTIDDTVRKRLLNVLEYIEEVEKIGSKIAFRVKDHNRPAFFEHQLQELPGIRFGDSVNSTFWLEVQRLEPINPPQPDSEILLSFSKIPNDPFISPTFDDEVLANMVDDPDVEDIDGETAARIQQEWDEFINDSYLQWKKSEASRRITIRIYATLFGLKRAMEIDSASDPIELVWGIGLSSWKTQGKIIEYPILLQGVELTIDDRSRNILVSPRESEPIIEFAPFSALKNEGVSIARKSVLEFLDELDRPLSPFDDSSFTGALNASISSLDSTGFYWDKNSPENSNSKPPGISERLMISNTWVLFVRPKTSHFLLQDLERLREVAKTAEKLPIGPNALFKDPSTEPSIFTRIPFRGVSSPNPEPIAGRNPEDLYFPKPYNQEQMQIVERLEQAPGVVAQGPPGTGKTHTIANIICHYLAKGRSILVTSKGEQALRVLKDKLPNGIRPLAVSLLSSDRQALKEMEQAVERILQRLQGIDQRALCREIDAGHNQIDLLCATVARAEEEIADWARKQLTQVTYQGRALMPDELAKLLVKERDIHSWLPPTVMWDEQPFQVSDQEIERLRLLRRDVGAKLKCHDWSLPEIDSLPIVDEIAELHSALTRRKNLSDSLKNDDLPAPKRDFTDEGLKRAQKLRKVLILARKVIGYHLEDSNKWLDDLFSIFKKDRDASEKENVLNQVKQLFNDVDALEKERVELLAHPVILPQEAIEDKDFILAINRQAEGKAPFGAFTGITKGTKKKWLKAVRLRAMPISDQQDWILVQRHLNYIQASQAIISRWNAFMQEFNGPVLECASTENCKKIAEESRRGQEVLLFGEKGIPFIRHSLPIVFNGPHGNKDILNSIHTVESYISALSNHLDQGELCTAVEMHGQLKRRLKRHKNELCNNLIQLVDFQVGNQCH